MTDLTTSKTPMISPLAYVAPSAKLAPSVRIYPFAYIDDNVEIGENCVIMPYASVMNGTRMGSGNKVYQGAIIGADPQDFRWHGEQTYCYIGNNNTIREHAIVNRGIHAEGGTTIGDDCFIMADSHVGHDSKINGRCVIGNGVSVAGDTEIGECTILSSGVIVHENSRVGQWCLIKGGCRITGNVPPFVIMAHNPATYFGVNAVVMQKKGFTVDEVNDAARAYRHVYQSNTSVFNAMRRILADVDEGRVRNAVVKFITDNNFRLVAIPRELEE